MLFIGLSFSPMAMGASSCGLNSELQNLAQAPLNRGSDVGFSVSVFNSSGTLECEDHFNPDKTIYPASTIKILIAVTALRKIDLNGLRLTDEVTISQSNADDECQFYGCDEWAIGKKQTVAQLLEAMLARSNNIATNQFMDLLSKDFINTVAKQLGMTNTQVHRKMYALVDPEPGLSIRNISTSRDLGILYRFLKRQRALWLLSEESNRHLHSVLEKQRYNNQLNKRFPEEVFFFHKTGSTSRAAGDAGYFMTSSGKQVIISAMQENPQRVGRPRWDIAIHNQLGELVLHHFHP
tara:strand:+ start:111735 stop:112616 length:882 start_codon:yes stop_codon:yes gene_type:complete